MGKSSAPNPKVDAFLRRAKTWQAESEKLRAILLACGLEEELKWGKPCYSAGDNNIVILQPMKPHLALMFFKGALMKDPKGVLEEQGPNSRSARRICFRKLQDVVKLKPVVQAYIREAIKIEESGVKVEKPKELALVEELQKALAADRKFKAAFSALTPGRQREYNLHFSSAKQSATRAARIEKVRPKILAGKGFRDL
ncbi:MAG: DUF1801 domain-containing protein [Polyangiaceae bacterium]